MTALLFSIGRLFIALYLSHSNVASAYGAAGSLVALLIWIYYSCAILFYGAKFTRAYREEKGLKVTPKSTAVLVREEIVDETPAEREETVRAKQAELTAEICPPAKKRCEEKTALFSNAARASWQDARSRVLTRALR